MNRMGLLRFRNVQNNNISRRSSGKPLAEDVDLVCLDSQQREIRCTVAINTFRSNKKSFEVKKENPRCFRMSQFCNVR